MRILTWNINGIRAWAKKGHFEWLLNQNLDIFCFQETKATIEQVPPEIAKPSGYESYFDSPKEKKGYSGVAIYSKVKPNKIEYAMGSDILDNEGRLVAAYYDDFVLVNVYFPNGGGGPERLKFKLDFYDEFLKYIDKLRKKGHKVIFCGDINTAHEEIDLARPKANEKNTGFLPEERAWLDEVVNRGYVDVFRHFYPSKAGAYTYWDQKTFARERNVGWRIDYFFVSPDLLVKVKGIEILSNVYGSDHCPIVLEGSF
ncbi:MAG: exodeoxyribonuclease III [Candidatus Taylorbacteria bacterium RIFCSPLOWO2_01_FULL_45_15b]|uniref:Exodeoxyribonuclease III n=1 Tax=Candidatus Taylorbacteria bacterium RIFCSPLOWO2_01_FULL_45_15b TaxID=1802319 RepID=A0A1G2N9P9_9BACT|nr:MAG: exodeoxyribonuclease III [Candidatus Taylorbacteria bacterium RIFCSPLOWO2_01_FULL_45_15b]